MNRSASRNFSANEKEIDKLLKEVGSWRESLSYIAEEINFIQVLLKSDVFKPGKNLHDILGDYYEEVEEMRTENLDLIKEVHNHRYDIEGILECEDISCEVFYHEEHVKLGQKLKEFAEKFRKFKHEVFFYTGNQLRAHSSN